MRLLTIAAAAAFAVCASAASATATYDPVSKLGTLPKDDVEAAYGWDNAQLLAALDPGPGTGRISVYVDTTASYYVTCEWDQVFGSRTIHRRSGYVATVSSTQAMGVSWSGNALTSTISDFTLYGIYSAPVVTGSIPEIGDQCGPYGRGGGAALVASVSLVSDGGVVRFQVNNEPQYSVALGLSPV